MEKNKKKNLNQSKKNIIVIMGDKNGITKDLKEKENQKK
jgi:hypothetical protein